jgi:hypothetical protein
MWINKFIGILAINQKSPKDITEGILLVFLRPNIRQKAMEMEEETLCFRDISRFSIVNIS